MTKRRTKKKLWLPGTVVVLALLAFYAYQNLSPAPAPSVSLDSIPAFTDQAYVAVNDNKPFFTDSDLTTKAFETYSELDALGRCGAAYANICQELMPAEDRESIGQVKPTGWQISKYDFVDGKYLQPLPSHRFPAGGRKRQPSEPHHRHPLSQCHRYAAL